MPRILALGTFYGERSLLDVCTLAANRTEVSAIVGGAGATLEQITALMQLGLPSPEFSRLTRTIREESLAQVLNLVDQRVKQLTEAELSRFFSSLAPELLTPTHRHFSAIRTFCAEVGARATAAALSGLDVPALTQMLVLQSSLRHFRPYLTPMFFTQTVSSIAQFSPEVVLLAKNYVSHTPELISNFSHFTKTAGS